jgi:predicted nucleic acid-binding protein
MKVVSNASPIIFLSKIDALDLLPPCFDEILIPSAVANELVDYHPPAYIQQIQISPTESEFVWGAVGRLHTRELEAMVLAQETQADYIILDDLLARRKAQRLSLKTIGTIGILLLAHKKSLLSRMDLEGHLSRLIKDHRMYLSPSILAKIMDSLK